MDEMNVKAVETTENKESRPKIIAVDFDGCLDSLDTRAAIYQMETELPYFRVVGSRKALKNKK